MSGDFRTAGPDLQQLAQTVLAMLQPMIEAATAYASAAQNGTPGTCTQAWCPVCAVVAAASGERHPLVAFVAEHGVSLLSLLSALSDPAPVPPDPGGRAPDDEPPTTVPGRYEPIAVTIHG